MRILLDTNILTRLVDPSHALYRKALDATESLGTQGHTLCMVPQNLYEFWVVCTRPKSSNGLEKTASEATTELANMKGFFTLLDDTPALFPSWEQLVIANAVLGKNAHDARLVAAMLVHGITHLLTFNDSDFRRYPGITVLTPSQVLVAPPAGSTSPQSPAPPP